MRVTYQAKNSSDMTERFRVDFTGAEYAALAELAQVISGEDALAGGLQRIAKEHRLDCGSQPELGDE